MPSKEDAALGTTIGVGVVASAPWVAGFTSAGVTAGSAAAGFQAGIGNVVGGSAFAAMQSLGAVTVLGTALPAIATGTVIAAAVVYKCGGPEATAQKASDGYNYSLQKASDGYNYSLQKVSDGYASAAPMVGAGYNKTAEASGITASTIAATGIAASQLKNAAVDSYNYSSPIVSKAADLLWPKL